MNYPSRLYSWLLWGGWAQFIFLICLFTFLSLNPSPGEVFQIFWDKALHFIGWFALAVSLALAWRNAKHFWLAALLLWGYSCAIEFVQELTGRQFSVEDMFANAAGIVAAVFVCWFVRPLVTRAFAQLFERQIETQLV